LVETVLSVSKNSKSSCICHGFSDQSQKKKKKEKKVGFSDQVRNPVRKILKVILQLSNQIRRLKKFPKNCVRLLLENILKKSLLAK